MAAATDEVTFSLDEAMAAQAAMRGILGLPPERFPLSAFVGMVSDEIAQLRAAGMTDDTIAGIVTTATHRDVSAADIAAHCAPPEARQRG